MDKKTLALWGMMVASPFLVEAKTNEIPAKLDKNTLEVVLKGNEEGEEGMEKVFSLKNFFTEEVEQAVDSLGNGEPELPVANVGLILNEGNTVETTNSIEENERIMARANAYPNGVPFWRTKADQLGKQVKSLENKKQELAREYLEFRGELDAGEGDAGWEKYKKQNPQKYKDILRRIEEGDPKILKYVTANGLDDYKETKEAYAKATIIVEIYEAIDTLYSRFPAKSSLKISDGKFGSDFRKLYGNVYKLLNKAKKIMTEEEIQEYITTHLVYEDLKKGKELIVNVYKVKKIIEELEKKRNNIAVDDASLTETALNLLMRARGIGTVNEIEDEDGKKFKEYLIRLTEFFGLVGLDENRRIIKDYHKLLKENNYPENLKIDNLEDFLKFAKQSFLKGLFGGKEGKHLNDIIAELEKSISTHENYEKVPTKTNVPNEEIKKIKKIIDRYNKLRELKNFKDEWEELSDNQKVAEYDDFSERFEIILSNYLNQKGEMENKKALEQDLEELGKPFWQGVYEAMMKWRVGSMHSGRGNFGGIIRVSENGGIKIENP